MPCCIMANSPERLFDIAVAERVGLSFDLIDPNYGMHDHFPLPQAGHNRAIASQTFDFFHQRLKGQDWTITRPSVERPIEFVNRIRGNSEGARQLWNAMETGQTQADGTVFELQIHPFVEVSTS